MVSSKEGSSVEVLETLLEISLHGSNQMAAELPRAGRQPRDRVEIAVAGFRFSIRAWMASQVLRRPPFARAEVADAYNRDPDSATMTLTKARPGFWAQTVSLLLTTETVYQTLIDSLSDPTLQGLHRESPTQQLVSKMGEFLQGAAEIYDERILFESNFDIARRHLKPLRLGVLPAMKRECQSLLESSRETIVSRWDRAHTAGVVDSDGEVLWNRLCHRFERGFAEGSLYIDRHTAPAAKGQP